MHLKNQIFEGAENRETLIDLKIPEGKNCTDLILFLHGYKGFKDWGCWNLVMDYFVNRGIGFCKFNFSHNGGTVDNPFDFPDLEAFAENRYTYELEDIACALDWLDKQIDLSSFRVHLIGHSRGGGDAILAGDDERIHSIITWSAIADIKSRFPTGEELKKWREKGVRYVKNARTDQDMPHYFTMYEDWEMNQELLDIQFHATQLKKPCLHLHGDSDQAVPVTDAVRLSERTHGKLIVIQGADHTYGSSHPWQKEILPDDLLKVCEHSEKFITEDLG
ncbi:MAG: alpha/beta fold hydrolase [Brumimicrobium sp.]|nr:alpha/beta fold hydrolase [Brumimicrobium sp.]